MNLRYQFKISLLPASGPRWGGVMGRRQCLNTNQSVSIRGCLDVLLGAHDPSALEFDMCRLWLKPTTRLSFPEECLERFGLILNLWLDYYSCDDDIYFAWPYFYGVIRSCVLSFLCSYNFDKLASSSHLLFSSCGFKGEIVWTQTFWSKSCNGLWYSKWDLHWSFEFEPGFQFCWILSGTIVIVCSILTLDLHILCSFSIFPKILNYSYCFSQSRWPSWQSSLALFSWRPFSLGRDSGFSWDTFALLWLRCWRRMLILIYNNY